MDLSFFSFSRGTGQLPPHGHNEIIIREVWANNLEEEFAILRDIIEDFPVVSMVVSFSLSLEFILIGL